MKKIKELLKKIIPATYQKTNDLYKLMLKEMIDINDRV